MDYLKYDNCNNGGSTTTQQYIDRYSAMRDALAATGRPILYSLCEWGVNEPWTWGPAVGNSWRTTGDISDKYSSMLSIFKKNVVLAPYAGPGHWNDPDMLEVGNGGMNAIEYRTHMSLWAILAAPLLAGNDLTKMSPETLSILGNREVIAIDQDPAGRQGDRVQVEGPLEVWAKPLAGGGKAVGLFNTSDLPANMAVDFAAVGFKAPVRARDVWAGKDLGKLKAYRALIPAHGVVLLRLG